MLRIILYVIVFYLVYRVIKSIADKLLSPNNQKSKFQKEHKKDIIDVDYEEVDKTNEGK